MWNKFIKEFAPYLSMYAHFFGGGVGVSVVGYFSPLVNLLGIPLTIILCFGIGMFLTICWKIYKKHNNTLENVIRKKFKNETVYLDGKNFVNCEFDGCKMVYNGYPMKFDQPIISGNCKLFFETDNSRNVARMIALFNEMSKKNGSDLVGIDEFDRIFSPKMDVIKNEK